MRKQEYAKREKGFSIYSYMDRPDINDVMMDSALLFAERSTCARVKAGAVISIDDHIVSTGYNGNAPGKEHCNDHFKEIFEEKKKEWSPSMTFSLWQETEEFKEMHHDWAIRNELHAEMNAIIYAARRGIQIQGGAIYTTYSPCLFCTKAIIQAGLKEVYYNKLYDKPEGRDSLQVLKENGIHVEEISGTLRRLQSNRGGECSCHWNH